MSLLSRLLGRNKTPATAPFNAPVMPEDPFFVVGDVHGCIGQMTTLMDKINAASDTAPIIFVGDYVDRGEASADVLRALFAMKDDPRITCLAGNHEEMMLKFLDNPAASGARWLRYGGLQTMASFGVGGVGTRNDDAALDAAAAKLRTAMGDDMIAWLRALPLTWQNGNVAVVHAAADPALPIKMQSEQALKWGHPDFETTPRSDDVWVVHGHTIVDEAHQIAGRIAIDTGAYATNRLTAAHITRDAVHFIQS